MSKFSIYPAIDLREGKVVRLKKGDPTKQTIYSADPAEIAQSWRDDGAIWMHVVNLDGAFEQDSTPNLQALNAILRACQGQTKVQFGGGMREIGSIEAILGLGVARVIIGTAALEKPSFPNEALDRFGARKIAFALDAFNGELMTRGWQEGSGISLADFAHKLADLNAQTFIYTNIHKDGMETGVDWEIARSLAKQTGLEVIASGGVANIQDVRNVKDAGLDGVIIGRALYENNFTLQEALGC